MEQQTPRTPSRSDLPPPRRFTIAEDPEAEDPGGRRELTAAHSELLRFATRLEKEGRPEAAEALRRHAAALLWAELDKAYPGWEDLPS